MKNYVEGTIDDLLEDVDQALLTGYAQKHGRSLKWANAAYKVVCRDRDALRRKGSILFWSWVPGILVIACYAPAAILELLGLCALMILWQVLVLRTYKENADAASSYKYILADFRAAVYALDPTASSYSGDSVRAMLVDAASWVLAAQRLLDKHMQCPAAEVPVNFYWAEENLLHLARRSSVRNFNQRMQAAEEFGLTFKKAELFRDAAAILSCFKI